MMCYKDYTIKAKLENFDRAEQALNLMKANYIGLDYQADTYFETSRGKLKLREGTIENLITHYERTVEGNIEKTIVYRYDKNPSMDEIASLRNSQQIGLVKKERKIFKVDNIKIHLDTLPDGQRFIEIEAIDVHNVIPEIELKRQCLAMIDKLGINDIDLIETGYISRCPDSNREQIYAENTCINPRDLREIY